MAIVVSDSRNASYDGNLSTANGFYRAEFGNLGCYFSTLQSLTSTVNYSVTFANAGNCMGVACILTASAAVIDRPLKVELQELVGGTTWTARTSKTLTAVEILRTPTPVTAASTETVEAGLITQFKFDTPYPVTTTAGIWRLQFTSTAGTSNWNIRQCSSGVFSLVAWCDNQISYTDNADQFVAVDPIIINQSTTFLGAIQATDSYQHAYCGWICSGSDRSPDNVCNLKWASAPASSYECAAIGFIIYGSASGFRAGTSASPIPIASKGRFNFLSPIVGTFALTGSVRDSAGFSAAHTKVFTATALSSDSSRGGHIFCYGEKPTVERTTFVSASGTTLVTSIPTGWTAGGKLAIGKMTTRGNADTNVYTIVSVAGDGVTITLDKTIASARTAGGQVFLINGYGFVHTSMGYIGGSTSRFDITNPTGTTFRYTWDGTGTNPNISSAAFFVGSEVRIQAQNFSAGNKGTFYITASSTNWFEVTNPAGVAENDKTIGTGYIYAESIGMRVHTPAINNIVFEGVEIRNVHYVTSIGGVGSQSRLMTDPPYTLKNCSLLGINTLISSFYQVSLTGMGLTPMFPGCVVQNVNCFRMSVMSGMTTGNGQGPMLFDSNVTICQDGAVSNTTTGVAGIWTVTNNVWENGGNGSMLSIAASVFGCSFRNNRFWGSTAPGGSAVGTVRILAMNYVTDWSGNKYDNCLSAIQVGGGAVTYGCKASREEFGQELANTVDIYSYYRGNPRIEFDNCKGNITTCYFSGVQSSNLPAAQIILSKVNQVDGNDRIEKQEGTLYKAGTGLADTTQHVETYCLKFVPYYNAAQPFYIPDVLTWEQRVPTENIQNKAMVVGVWIKLNSANYWAGTAYQMPRLTVNHDNGTLSYAEAAKTTDWQYLAVPFTPLTTYGELTVTVSGKTDAGGVAADATFYAAEMSVLYPAGHNIALGKMGTWASALPVMPSISTTISAGDVWAVAPSSFGTGTVGKLMTKLLQLAQFIGLK